MSTSQRPSGRVNRLWSRVNAEMRRRIVGFAAFALFVLTGCGPGTAPAAEVSPAEAGSQETPTDGGSQISGGDDPDAAIATPADRESPTAPSIAPTPTPTPVPIPADRELRLDDVASQRWTPTDPDVVCDIDAAGLDVAETAVRVAAPGDVICVSGDHGPARLRIERSGSADAPVVVVGRGARLGGIDIAADDVEIHGFELGGGTDGRPAIDMVGARIVISGNRIVDPGGHGILCGTETTECRDIVIDRNLIRGADGSGIMIFGEGNVVSSNEVSGSVRRNANDADGIRFFGFGHRLSDNLIHSIFDRGYEGEGPHTDCFQTFDNSKPPTVDTIIERNVCFDVDHQCLIATAQESGRAGEVGRSRGLVFRNNICANNGSQSILLQEFPDVEISNNLFLDTVAASWIILQNQSTGSTIVNNVFVGRHRAYLADDGSASGFVADHNLHDVAVESSPVRTEPNGQWGVDPLFSGDPAPGLRFAPTAASPLVDAGTDIVSGDQDIRGALRVQDGDRDGVAVPDIGPYELG